MTTTITQQLYRVIAQLNECDRLRLLKFAQFIQESRKGKREKRSKRFSESGKLRKDNF